MQRGQQVLERCPQSAETNIDQDINNLKEKWESVETKLNERKVRAWINIREWMFYLFHFMGFPLISEWDCQQKV